MEAEDRFDLAEDADQWLAVVSTAMDLLVS
jgi:hypothetical protein